ncbi:MAG: sulfotransferase, partial [Candidatus Rokuibacteriota bacterium]
APPDRFVDVRYTDLVRDPIAVVRRVYEHFTRLAWSASPARPVEDARIRARAQCNTRVPS